MASFDIAVLRVCETAGASNVPGIRASVADTKMTFGLRASLAKSALSKGGDSTTTTSLASSEVQVFELSGLPKPAVLTSTSSIWFECSHSLGNARLSLPASGKLEVW